MECGKKEVFDMNAIILAAGAGLRIKEMATQGHKAFLPIGGVPIIERIIRYLHEAEITDITIVTGYKHDQFLFLKEHYGVKLLYNKRYATHNNLESLELVLDRIGDTFIIHGDIALFKNIFKMENRGCSFFYTMLKESKGVPLTRIHCNRNRIITDYEGYAGRETVVTNLGISYWTRNDATDFKRFFHQRVDEKMKKRFGLSWEDIFLALSCEKVLEAHQLDRKYGCDINILMDYLNACSIYDRLWKNCDSIKK